MPGYLDIQGYLGTWIYRDIKVQLDIQGYQGTWIFRNTRVSGYSMMKGYLLDIQGSQGTWIPYIYTRVPVYTGIPGYLDMQERQGIWIYRDTRVSGYTGIAWFWVYRDIRVPVSTRIHGYQGTWINRDISVSRCTWISWISMYISTQLNPRCLLIKILNTTHSFYLLIYLSTTP